MESQDINLMIADGVVVIALGIGGYIYYAYKNIKG